MIIEELKLKFGVVPVAEPILINIAPVTIFVGPNNSGKSRILQEIDNYCRNADPRGNLILKEIKFAPLEGPEEEIKHYHAVNGDPYSISRKGNRHGDRTTQDTLMNAFKNPNADQHTFCRMFLMYYTVNLNGANRTILLTEQKAEDLLKPSTTSFGILYKDDVLRSQVSRIVYSAFQQYFVVDPTNLGSYRVKLSNIPPLNNIEKRLDEEAIQYFSSATDSLSLSDGIKAFIGAITTIVAGSPKVILLDEAEAFLHPPLAYKLGYEVCRAVSSTGKNLFASTHSSNFLMGCVQAGVPVNIVRLTYKDGIPTAKVLYNNRVSKLMKHPLLRSAGVLSALFYDYVIVTESDSDRAFYQEINERMLAFTDDGIANCLFLNAQNKQTVHEIIRPLREMGIPCVGIVDVDVVKEGGAVWSNLLSSASIPSTTISGMATSRSHIKNAFDVSGRNFKREGGVDVLSSPDKQSCNDLFDQLDKYGIFAVRKGELESWLPNLNVRETHSPAWLIEIFEKMGEDPINANYVKPTTGDVWDFIRAIKKWFENPDRLGMPE